MHGIRVSIAQALVLVIRLKRGTALQGFGFKLDMTLELT
jgi:hypothetical protein